MDDVFHEMMTPTSARSQKRPVWQIVVAVAVALVAVLTLLWLIVDPFAESPKTTFEGAKMMVGNQAVPVEPNRRIGQNGCVFTVTDADLRDMTVTISLSQPMYSEGEEYRKLELRYDEEITLYATREDSQAPDGFVLTQTRVRIVLPDVKEKATQELPIGTDAFTVYTGVGVELYIHDGYYEWVYGSETDERSYGTYEQTDTTLVLNETAGLTCYVFACGGDVMTYDDKASYRHPAARTPALKQGDTLTRSYRYEQTRLARNEFEYAVIASDGTPIVRDTTQAETVFHTTLEPHLLQLCMGTLFEGTQHRYVHLETGEATDLYGAVVCETKGGIVCVERHDGKTIVTLEPIPWHSDPVPRTLTTVFDGDYVQVDAHIDNDRLIIDYGIRENEEGVDGVLFSLKPNAVAMTLKGESVAVPLLVKAPGITDVSEILNATSIYYTAPWRVSVYGIMDAYRWRGDTYWNIAYELENGTLTPERLEQEVLDDIAAGKAAKIVHEDKTSFTACYGGDYENITFWYKDSGNEVYIGAVPAMSEQGGLPHG